MQEYTEKQIEKMAQNLPDRLRGEIFDKKTGDKIIEICQRNKVKKEYIIKISEKVGYVLLGILPLERFQESLEKELPLEKELSEALAIEIDQIIFTPVKKELREISKEKTEIETTERTEPKKKGKDVYRETIE